MMLPQVGMGLSDEQVRFLEVFSKSCRHSILQMVVNAQSGHPGGSLSTIDYLSLLYAFWVTDKNSPVVVSNGHISPAVYSVLAELNVIPKDRVVELFRRPDDLYEGHVNRKIQGIWYGTGPLGVGTSVASGIALSNRFADDSDDSPEHTFLVLGDGEAQEGQVYEMMNFAAKYKLSNLIAFVDYNQVQLTDSLEEVMPTNIRGHFEASGWKVLEVDAHDFRAMWGVLSEALSMKGEAPILILGNSIMGKGVSMMEPAGHEYKADWHGKAPKPEEAKEDIESLVLNEEEKAILKEGLASLPMNIKTPAEPEDDMTWKLDVGEPMLYEADVMTDCRGAYGNALLDLAKRNDRVVALTADLAGSVKTDGVKKEKPLQHIECGIAEQHMVSVSGGLSVMGILPFCSTFGAFMSSRAKDQARVNDINECNVKMVATHCGLSVGEDGPTHQAIDDISSFAGFMHTHVFEPADPNQCDRIIRHVAGSYGNVYVRMGRAKIPVITKEDGSPYFNTSYVFKPGKADVLREGGKATIVAAGPMVIRALEAAGQLGGDIEVIAVSSFIPFDEETILASARKTGGLVTVHDHHVRTGLASFVSRALSDAQVAMPTKHLGVDHYQLSGTSDELYELAGLGVSHIVEAVKGLMQ